MPTPISHFAIHTDDIDRARHFYAGVFAWNFDTYGPEDFLQIKDASAAPIGALQSRKYSPVPERVVGLECTFGVEDIDATLQRVLEHGGTVVLPKTSIPFVGWIAKFLDTEGNLLCAMHYDPTAR